MLLISVKRKAKSSQEVAEKKNEIIKEFKFFAKKMNVDKFAVNLFIVAVNDIKNNKENLGKREFSKKKCLSHDNLYDKTCTRTCMESQKL